MKTKAIYICSQCGYQTQKWMGKCPSCNQWGTLIETTAEEKAAPGPSGAVKKARRPVKRIDEITYENEERITTGIGELDRVLGGGLVKGSMILVGGDPGIGKSTLLLQICENIGKNKKILYVSGEESEKQIKLRARRLGTVSAQLYIVSENDTEKVIDMIAGLAPEVVIIDSIQTMHLDTLSSCAGSVPQVREATNAFMTIAKRDNISMFIVGHVTKDGSIAGPRILEHMVDCVLYFEGDRQNSFRILRAVKNRFGSTNEIGVFSMTDRGLSEVENPSMMLLEGRCENISGNAVVCTMEGSRGVLAEIQALVTPTGFGNPRRMSDGIDLNRLILMLAVLEKRCGLSLSSRDVYINVAGGLKIYETAVDLAVCAAVISSLTEKVIPADTVFMGEVGLGGEMRSVSQLEKRLSEVSKLGFKTAVVPKMSLRNVKAPQGLNVIGVSALWEVSKLISNNGNQE